ncbi:MAG: UDP-4-amino-4,6-dideoxy-N-acetyl-beta-L-altrosamine transaminase [Burkholderiaceae bacterium]
MIPYGRQEVTQADIDAVDAVLRSDFLTQGPAVARFEQALAAYCGATHGVAMANATAALHLACLALDLGPGDWLWTSPNTFLASANCGVYCGARVDFVDVDPRTYNMELAALEAKLERAARATRAAAEGRRCTRRPEPRHEAAIGALAKRYGFRVVEDASHAVGGRYRDAPVGSCAHSDITVFSFHPVKIVTTGEGGMALTNDAALARRLERLRSHGMTRDAALMDAEPDGPWYYQQVELGYNYRITDIQAALGLSQLARLDDYVRRRHRLADRYDALLAGLPVIVPARAADAHSALHLYPIQVDAARCGRSRRQVFDALRAAGIGVNVHYIPVHTQPYYRRMGFSFGDFPRAEAYYAQAISLPMFATLTDAQQDEVVAALRRALA